MHFLTLVICITAILQGMAFESLKRRIDQASLRWMTYFAITVGPYMLLDKIFDFSVNSPTLAANFLWILLYFVGVFFERLREYRSRHG